MLAANIIVGLANWEGLGRELWALDTSVLSLVEQAASLFNGLQPMNEEPSTSKVVQALDDALEAAERGIFVAPAMHVPDLLYESGGLVYLL